MRVDKFYFLFHTFCTRYKHSAVSANYGKNKFETEKRKPERKQSSIHVLGFLNSTADNEQNSY